MNPRPARLRHVPFLLAALLAGAAPACETAAPAPPAAETFAGVVEASCGGCQLGLASTGCELAIRVDGRVLLVDGTRIDDHGDAHAADGFCNAIRQARVSGRIEGDRFVADTFELLPPEPAR